MDVFRQPKYAYYMFKAQRSPEKQDRLFETGPMVYIAHEMTPFSPKDVTVYSNCDEVRLTYNKGGKTWTYTKPATKEGNALTRYYIQRYIRLHDRQKHVYEKEETGPGVPTGRRHHRWKSSCHARSTTGPASRESATLG